MIVGERKCLIVPGIVGILVSRPKIDHSGLGTRLSECTSNELVEAFILKDDGNGYLKYDFAIPTS